MSALRIKASLLHSCICTFVHYTTKISQNWSSFDQAEYQGGSSGQEW